jgi:hypothetical protein
MKESTIYNPQSTIPNRCDNCFFSTWMKSPARAVLACKQKPDLLDRWQVVLLDEKCPNFYPSGIFTQGATATRRISLTKGKFAVFDEEDYYQLVKFQWHAIEPANNTFYAARTCGRKSLKMHRQIMNAPKHLVVDHIDHNGLNNCKSNLRLCTIAQNCRNTVPCGVTSKYKGICWKKRQKKWIASIKHNNNKYFLGYFIDEVAAAKAYDQKAKELHGEFAYLNFPLETTKN